MRVAADDPIQYDGIRGGQRGGGRHEVALDNRHPSREAAGLGFTSSHDHIGRRRVDRQGTREARGQELEARGTNPGANVQYRLAGAGADNAVPELPCGWIRALPLVEPQVNFGPLRVELY